MFNGVPFPPTPKANNDTRPLLQSCKKAGQAVEPHYWQYSRRAFMLVIKMENIQSLIAKM